MSRISSPITSTENWLMERSRVITSTEVAALFKCNPYMTEFELWNRKKSGDVVRIDETERMKWGTRLESVIAEGAGADMGVAVEPFKTFIYDDELRIGSSFDYLITGESPAIMEIKNVDGMVYRDKWIDDGETIEAPPHIELQVQFQMLVSGIHSAWIIALVGGNKIVKTPRKYNERIGQAVLKKVSEFWASVDAGAAPAPDFERDADYIVSLYDFAEPGTEMAADEHIEFMAHEYKVFSEKIKELEKQKDGVKAKLLMAIGQAEKCKGHSFTISAGVVGPAEVSYKRDGYRSFKLNWKKKV